MQAWADHCDGKDATNVAAFVAGESDEAKVVPLKRR